MKLAVIGSRSFADAALLGQILEDYKITKIISGGAKGADTLAEQWAKRNNVETEIYLPDWKHGRAAGPIRNRSIIEACDECVAFWDGKSAGTRNSIDLCKKSGKPVNIVFI
jgi:predicted Rossmann fold nucleotide-binding protein DprA/Smf involved in DNA uptake